MCTPLTFAILFLAGSVSAALAQVGPASLPARDAHEGLLVAADPYQDAARYRIRFGKKNPYEAGILAIEVFFRNDNDKPIRLDLQSIRLLIAPPGAERQRLIPLTVEHVVDRILNKGGPNPSLPRGRVPIPGRGPKPGHSKEWNELETALRAAALEMDILPPRSSVHGFLFFDVNHHYDLLAHARLYLPDLKFMHNNQPLLFFELELATTAPR